MHVPEDVMKRKSVPKKRRVDSSRRRFLKKASLGVLVTSAYSLISLTHFACKDSSTGPSTTTRGGNGYYGQGYY
jgi:hypothetical protein